MKLKSKVKPIKKVEGRELQNILDRERMKWKIIQIENFWFTGETFVEVWIEEDSRNVASMSYRGLDKDIVHFHRKKYEVWGSKDGSNTYF